MSTSLKKSLLEGVILLQGFVAALKAGSSFYLYARFMFIGYDGVLFLIIEPLFTLLWWILLFTIITQIRLKSQATAKQTFYFEITKSVIITVLAIWFVVQYLLMAPRIGNRPPYFGEISVFHRVYSVILFLVFNGVLFYPTLWVGWKGTREGGISLGEHAESLLP